LVNQEHRIKDWTVGRLLTLYNYLHRLLTLYNYLHRLLTLYTYLHRLLTLYNFLHRLPKRNKSKKLIMREKTCKFERL
jgi:hypothetical protein